MVEFVNLPSKKVIFKKKFDNVDKNDSLTQNHCCFNNWTIYNSQG